jgi:hypothetical protein
MPRSPKGVLSRGVPDWYCKNLYGSQIAQSAVGGQASNCTVFNASNDGTVFYFYSVAVFVSASTFVNFKQENARNYTASGDVAQPIDPRQPKSQSVILAGTKPVCLGTHVGGIPMLGGQNQVYAPGWPFLIIPSGFGATIECANNNVTLQVAIYWLELKGGGF